MSVESEILDLINESPRSPKEIVDAYITRRDVSTFTVRDTIWELIDSGKVEVNADLKLELKIDHVS